MTPITDIDEQTRNEENTKMNYITPEIQKNGRPMETKS